VWDIWPIRFPKRKRVRKRLFERAPLTINHRGPDTDAVKDFDDKAILGHGRLSIIDLGEQSN